MSVWQTLTAADRLWNTCKLLSLLNCCLGLYLKDGDTIDMMSHKYGPMRPAGWGCTCLYVTPRPFQTHNNHPIKTFEGPHLDLSPFNSLRLIARKTVLFLSPLTQCGRNTVIKAPKSQWMVLFGWHYGKHSFFHLFVLCGSLVFPSGAFTALGYRARDPPFLSPSDHLRHWYNGMLFHQQWPVIIHCQGSKLSIGSDPLLV